MNIFKKNRCVTIVIGGAYDCQSEDTCVFLQSLGFKALKPSKGLNDNVFAMLRSDSLYLHKGWEKDMISCIQYDIALRMGKEVLFENEVVHTSKDVILIKDAIHEVTGMRFEEYDTQSRRRETFYARMLFAHHCYEKNIRQVEIARYINRDHSTIPYLIKKYRDEVAYNSEFRTLAEKVGEILK